MGNPAFDLFEEICTELREQNESVMADDDFSPMTLEAVKRAFQDPAPSSAIAKALSYLEEHFVLRGSGLPFNRDSNTGQLVATQSEYIQFVCDAQEQRSSEKESMRFEIATANRLATRLTGILCRVGWPRTKHKKPSELSSYLNEHFG